MQSDNIVPKIEESCVSDGSEATISPEATVDLPILVSRESLSARRTSVPETTKSSNDSIDPNTSVGPGFEDGSLSTARLESTLAVMASELAFYKQGYEDAKDECLILENQRRQIESLGKLPKDVTRILKENIRTIASQERKLDNRANLERYLSFSKVSNAESNSEKLIGLFQNLKDSIAKVLVMDDAKEHPVESLLRISVDLDGLLSSVFGIDSHCKLDESPNASLTLTSFELVHALTGASIHEWVFGAEFQVHMMRTTPLLDEYRSLISTWCKLGPLDFPRDITYVL